MGDADVFAYEQELDEMDEWEAMHAHEMEAAEEEMRAMEEAERKLAAAVPAKTAAPVAVASSEPVQDDGDDTNEEEEEEEAEDDSLARAQERLNKVLARCSTILGEDEDGDVRMEEETEQMDHLIARRKKATATATDATTASYLHSRPPIDVASMPVVLKDGTRMFLRKKAAQSTTRTAAMRKQVDANSLVPIHALMDTIQQRQIAATIADEEEMAEILADTADRPASEPRSTELWLDKYRPQGFIDLLSDERTNREVLAWIKKWDPYVFPHKKQSAASLHAGTQNKKPYAGATGGIFGKAPSSHPAGQDTASDEVEDKRPYEKIILICGPPGAGKTTLANIVARHAGYNPIEVNASDDRTADVLKNKIISAMEMQSIFGSRKPNCIILDEIDGAMNGGDGRSAIAAIQEIVSAPLRPKKSSGKATGKNRHPLTRPLICICNDQFASVLRPLRQLAKIFVLDTPSPQRLITRLKHICRQEGLKRSTGALGTLCSSGENDIRYCVNALQFQSMRPDRGEANTPAGALGDAVSALGIGQKDQTRGVLDTMGLVFYQPRSKTSITPTPASELVADAALGLGNSSLLVNALDENLPSMIFNDPTMNKLCDAFEWLGLADAWDAKVRADQQFALTAYVPFAAVAVHHACCTSSRRRVAYPRAHFEAQKKLERAHNIVQSLLEASQLHPSMRVGAGVLVVDVVPSLLGILAPNIRRVNPSLQSKEEKAMVARLIDVMASLGLSFRPKFMPDGGEDFVLEPALHELMLFKHSEDDQVLRAMLPPLVRKMITREVELEHMRRSEGGGRGSDAAAADDEKAAGKDKAGGREQTAVAEKPAAFVLPELTEAQEAAKAEAMRRRNPFAFAHREAKRKREQLAREQQQQQQEEQGGRGDGRGDDAGCRRARVRYKFNEGYTSGIKTTVYMRDLF